MFIESGIQINCHQTIIDTGDFITVRQLGSLDYQMPAHPVMLPLVSLNLQVALSKTVVKNIRAVQ